jgi:hypothetical protein
MFMDFVKTIIPRQQSTKKVRQRSATQLSEIVRTAMVDTQSDVDAVTPENNSPQLHAVSSLIQM